MRSDARGVTPAVRAAAVRPASLGGRVTALAAGNVALVLLLAALAAVLLGLGPLLFVGDSWLTLVSGREIAQHGLPSVDALTVFTLGREWIDQQWLAQLAFYGAWAAGGLTLTLLVHTALVTAAIGIAAAASRARGASVRSTFYVAFAGLAVAPWTWTLRAQSMALPLFAATLALVALDRDLRRRRTFLVFAVLVVWANVHGSVLVGAAIVSLAGAMGLGELLLRRPSEAVWWRSALLLVAPWACVLASPYGFDLVGYYRTVLFDSPLREVATEWAAPPFSGYWIVFFVVGALVASLVAWTAWRRRRLALFDLAVLAFTLASSVRSARGIPWFALAVIVLVPLALDALMPRERAPASRRVALGICAAALAFPVIMFAAAVGGYERRLNELWPPAAAGTVAAAAEDVPGRKAVWPSDKHADWLLWAEPSLRGRVAHDVRFELLEADEYPAVVGFKGLKERWLEMADGYPILVFDPEELPRQVSELRAMPDVDVLYADDTIIAFRRALAE